MDDRWNTSPNARRVLQHADDTRPAWLWSQDGQRLIWANDAASLFLAKLKKHGLKHAVPAVPIKGQVARNIRLGSTGRTSLARIQLLAGEKPVSLTCATTPLVWEQGEPVLLIVGVDPIAPEVLDAAALEATDEPAPIEDAPQVQTDAIDAPPADAYARELQNWQETDAETAYEPAAFAPADDQDDTPEAWATELGAAPKPYVVAEDVTEEPEEPETGADDAPIAAPEEPVERAPLRRLSDLVDRLAADEDLYTPLTEADDVPPAGAFETEPEEEAAPSNIYKVTGRGFVPLMVDSTEQALDEPLPPPIEETAQPEVDAPTNAPTADTDLVERVSRYNFDELSRILNDRVGERSQQQPAANLASAGLTGPTTSGALVNLGGETLVLNRLPLGILVFRDQQILFANRAITEMIGYDSVEGLRQAGLAAVFPVMGPEGQEAGPVNHLVQRDGTLVPVTARLQSISWQGRPALMLSASTTEVRTGHEDAVKAFAQTFADIRGDGFIETSRSGIISAASASAVALLGEAKPMTGRTLSSLVGTDDAMALRAFLDRPARFAETARPCLVLRSASGDADLLLFALGQAGIVSGYFGFVRARDMGPARLAPASDADPALLGRISRGVRRPLNTIVGFSDIIRSKAFGALDDERYAGYADDIARAGQEIAALVDELDDYARLRDGRYLPQRASLDLTGLLESCVMRIRNQANGARVIVRNAISQTLPRVTADRASLAQAVLNLLASAIDQTPVGGTVVISAQSLDDGAIAIHVRDSSANAVDMAERFVVFRDGVDRNGQMLAPVPSSVGLALTRSLLAVNAVSLSVDPAGADGMLFTLKIPADLVDDRDAPQDEE